MGSYTSFTHTALPQSRFGVRGWCSMGSHDNMPLPRNGRRLSGVPQRLLHGVVPLGAPYAPKAAHAQEDISAFWKGHPTSFHVSVGEGDP